MPIGGGVETVLYNRYIATIGGFQLHGEAITALAGRVLYCPIEIPYKLTIDRLGCCHGTVAADKFYLAIYESEDEAPTNRLAVSPDTTCNGTERKQQVTISPSKITLTPNVYYVALEADNTTDVYWQNQTEITSTRMPQNITNGPAFYIEDLASYAEPPAIATPVFGGTGAPDVARTYLIWARVFAVIP